jgi:predicted CoA-binding protein
MTLDERIQAFLAGAPFAVVGASTARAKYGNKVLRCYTQHGLEVFPVNPRATEIEGLPAYADLGALPQVPHGISIITPPAITEGVVAEAVKLGVEHIWMQPGAESDAAVAYAEDAGANVIARGPCLLVVLGFRE